MKWTNSRKHFPDYSTWQDLLHVMLVTLVLAVIAALVIATLIILMEPQQTSADDWVNLRVARRLAPVVFDSVTTRASEPIAILLCEISAYSPSVQECDGNPLITASGKRVRVGGIAADLRILPFGSLVRIPSYNNGNACVVLDTGGMIKGLRLDVFMWKTEDARQWGRRKAVPVEILRIGW